MTQRSFCALSCFIIFVSILCSSCGQKTVPEGAQGETKSKVLRVGIGQEPADLDPQTTTGLPEARVQYALFEGLVSKDPRTLAVVPGVAESWDVSEDGLTYLFDLRKNAHWSDGTPIDAEDFVWSWQRALIPSLANQYAYQMFSIKNAKAFFEGSLTDFSQVGVIAVDTHTLKVELDRPVPYFLQLLDHHSMFPVPRHTVEKFAPMDQRGSLWTRPGNLVGNGPFTLSVWSPHDRIEVSKNTNYWDKENIHLDGIHFYPIEQPATEERMYRSGQLHIPDRIPPEKIPGYQEEFPDELRVYPYLSTYFYRFNVKKAPFDDLRVRKALAMSIDRELLTKGVTKRGEQPGYFYTPPDTNGYTTTARVTEDIARAQKLLAEAGYPDGKNFPRVTLLYNTHDDHRRVAQAIQQMWKTALNIEITLENQDWKVYIDAVRTGNYQIARAGWVGDYFDPNTFLDMFITDGGNNNTGWSNTRYDALIEQASLTQDAASRREYFDHAEKLLLEELPIMPIYIYSRAALIAPSVKNFHSNVMDYYNYKHVDLH